MVAIVVGLSPKWRKSCMTSGSLARAAKDLVIAEVDLLRQNGLLRKRPSSGRQEGSTH